MKNINRRSFIEIATVSAGVVGGALMGSRHSFHTIADLLAPTNPQRLSGSDAIHWSFGGLNYTSPMVAKSTDFRAWVTPCLERRSYSFKEEVVNACQALDKRRAGAPIALCYSGGVDSEVIAYNLKRMGIPFEMYFLDIFGVNAKIYEDYVKPFSRKLGKEVHVVHMSGDYFHGEYAQKVFNEFGFESPTYLAMTYLFEQLPAHQFIVTGDGDLDRVGDLYRYIGAQNPVPHGTPGVHIAYSSSSVLYHLWAQKNQRAGEYFFYTAPKLIAATLTDRQFQTKYPLSFTKNLIHTAFPEIPMRPKTTNWDDKGAAKHNAFLRRTLRQHATRSFDFSWQRLSGTAVQIDKIFTS